MQTIDEAFSAKKANKTLLSFSIHRNLRRNIWVNVFAVNATSAANAAVVEAAVRVLTLLITRTSIAKFLTRLNYKLKNMR